MDELIQSFRELKVSDDQILIGITGGIGSGKSTVARLVEEQGFTVFSSDDIAKDVMNNNRALQQELRSYFGDEILSSTQEIVRPHLAAKVFGTSNKHKKNLHVLNNLTHPYVVEELARRVRLQFEKGERCVFNESALLFEVQIHECYDYLLVVDAPEEVRIQRLMSSRNLTREEILHRISQQMSAAEKKELADFVVDNAGDEEALRSSITALLQFLPMLKPRGRDSLEEEE